MSAHDATELPPEPKTPLWLPALGAALFALGALVWALSSEDDISKDATESAAAEAPSAEPAASAKPPPPQAKPELPGRGRAQLPPGANPTDGRKMPDLLKKMREQAKTH